MGKPHRRTQYAPGLARAGRGTAALVLALAGVLLGVCPRAFALNPALDMNQYAHTAWRIREGFPNGRISAFAQTADGYLWIGTDLGLFRYDGVKAVPWQSPDQPLPDIFIRALLVARDGTLWIGTLRGLASWKDGKLTSYKELAGLVTDALLEDRQGTLWAGTQGFSSARLCAIQGGATRCYGEDGSLGGWVESLYEDRAGNLWAAAATGLWRWKPAPAELYPISNLVGTNQSLLEGDDGALLIASLRDGIRKFVNGRMKTQLAPTSSASRPDHLLMDRDGGLWIGTSGQGLLHVHQGKTDVFTKAEGLSGDGINSIFEDREGNIWVSTEEGLDRFRELSVTTLGSSQGLPRGFIGAVLADRDGSIWMATSDGLSRLSNGRITPVRIASPGAYGKNVSFGPLGLFQDDRGRIWVSTTDGFGSLKNDQFVRLSGLPKDGSVRSVAQDRGGNIWIAYNRSALFRVSPGDEVERLPLKNLGHEDLATALAGDPLRGGLWAGFFNGGLVYVSDGQVRASYTAADGLGQGFIQDIRISPDGTVWASTQGGLSRLKDGRIATLSSGNGLPCDTVHWSREDDAGSVWLYTACGLVRFPRSELDKWATAVDKDKNSKQSVMAAVLTDGVHTEAYAVGYSPIVTKSSDGKFWFVVPSGVSVFDPRHLSFNKLPPPVHVEQISGDHKVSWRDTWTGSSGNVRLPPLVRDVEVDYTALSFVEQERVQFRYKLEGWDSDWQEVGNRRQAFYSNLPPRNYTFRVIASNNSGIWNEEGAFLHFSVAPAYYQTMWFRLSCVAAFLALLWGLYQLRLQQLAREFNMRLDERVSERTRIARELHDSLLQGFQGLMFRLQAVRDMLPGRASEAVGALDIALERGDKVIAEGRDTVSDLREPLMGDSDIAQALTALGKDLALQSGNGLVPCVRVLLEGKERELNPMLRDEIYRIAREAMRNAFRHARAEKIEAEITYSDSEFLLHVRDDGGGIDPAFANQGSRAGHWGLPGMRERAKSFGGKLEVWSEHGAGTEIELSVPGAIAYGKSAPRRRFGLWRKKIGESDGQHS